MSVVAQRYADLTLCVINDGGDREATEQIVRGELPAGIDLEFVHNKQSIGQVAALNLGYTKIRREFFVVLDDDDTWAPTFLSSMIELLRRPESESYMAAVCHADVVRETYDGNQCTTVETFPHYRHHLVLSLFDQLNFSRNPPANSVVLRSIALDIVPTNDVAMPVMYDSEWMLRLLLKADIVVLPQTLAFYHHRINDRAGLGAARNSVFECDADIRRLRVLVQNQQLRRELATGALGVGFISSLTTHLQEVAKPLLSADAAAYIERKAQRYYRYRALVRSIESIFKRRRQRSK